MVTGAVGLHQLISGNGLGAMMAATVGCAITSRPDETDAGAFENGFGISSGVVAPVDG